MYKARNEIRQRLIRDYGIKSRLAEVATVLKMAKGYDDKTAISQAGHVISSFIDIYTGEFSAEKSLEISNDIFKKGDKSKYMKFLTDTRKIKQHPVTSPDYSEHLRRVIDV